MADPAPQASRIFISYRREDTEATVFALVRDLRSHFAADRIFKDTDSIPPGEDFVKFIKDVLESCSVLLAIIGRDWLTIQDQQLKRRLDNPDDFLRVEVASALKNDRIRVIPVLVERGTMPSAADLPPDLAELPLRNALELTIHHWESDVERLIQAIERASAASAKPAEPSLRPELDDLRKRREREIATHLAAAGEALKAKDYERTLWASEKALLLDPHSSEALGLLDRARKAIDEQKIDGWLAEAQQALSRGDIGGASELIDQALAIDPASEAALRIRKEMLGLRRARERERERDRAARAAIERAQASLDDEDFDAAVRHADDALAVNPELADAQEIRSKAEKALDKRRGERETKRRAQQTVADARGKFAVGAHEEALRLLREFSPTHDLVSQAIQDLQKEADVIATATAERARREADARLAEASAKFQEQNYAAARKLVEAAGSHDSQHPEIAPWLRRIDAALAEQAAHSRRGEAVRTALAEARKSFEKGELESAIRHADAALTIDPTLADAQALRERAQAALAERRTREEHDRLAAQTIERALGIFKAKEYAAAIDLLEGFSPPTLVAKTLDELRNQFQQIEKRRQEDEQEIARRRQEAEREAAERKRADAIGVILARGQANLDRGELAAALRDADELLELAPHSAEAQALRSAASAALQLRVQQAEEERLARLAAEKARADAAKADEERRQAEARDRKERERLAKQAADKARADAAKADEERRATEARAREREEAERQQKALEIVISRIEGHLAAGQLDEAEQLLTEAERSRPPSTAVAALRHRVEELRDQQALRAREARIQQLLVEAQSAFTAKSFKSAKSKAAKVLELAPDSEVAQSILASATRELHAATPEFWSIRGVGGLGAAAAVVLSATIGILYFGPTSNPSSGVRPDEAATPPIQQTPTSGGAATPPKSDPSALPGEPVRDPTPVPGSTDPLVRPPAPAAPTPDEARLQALRERAQGQLRTGRRGQALDTVVAGLKVDGKDQGLHSILDSLLDDAQNAAQRARDAARNAGAAAPPQPAFTEGLKLEAEATRLRRENKKDPAIRSFWRTAERFDLAARQWKEAEQARAKAIQDEQRRLAEEKARQKPTASQPTVQTPSGGTPAAGTPDKKVEPQPPLGPAPVTSDKKETQPQPGTQKPPAAEPARPPAVNRIAEEGRIKSTLQQYQNAYSALNAAAVKAVFPSVRADLPRIFDQYESYRLEIVNLKIDLSPDATSAVVVCRLIHAFKPKGAGRQQFERPQTFTLKKQGDTWIIAGLQAP